MRLPTLLSADATGTENDDAGKFGNCAVKVSFVVALGSSIEVIARLIGLLRLD
jgi:hypothetical protein